MGWGIWRFNRPWQQLFTDLMSACRLCASPTRPFAIERGRAYQQCSHCHSVMMAEAFLPDAQTEKALYLTHNNDVDDPRYQRFVSPIIEAVSQSHSVAETGLDFGCGNGPVITTLLRQKGFQITLFDPFFHNDNSVLDAQYDFIISCEVIEHLHQPDRVFKQLRAMLKPGGKLYCMTLCYDEKIDFAGWHYKNDPTHVFFYHTDSLPLIRDRYGFAGVSHADRLIIWST